MATEIIICRGAGQNYECHKYETGNEFTSGPNYLEDVIHVHEFDDSGTRNPFAPSDTKEQSTIEDDESSDPSFWPLPFFIFKQPWESQSYR